MTSYQRLQQQLGAEPRTWLVTGCAGFIGSHLVGKLIELGQRVVGLDNFATGAPHHLTDVSRRVGAEAWERFTFHEGTVLDIGVCGEATKGVDFVLHHAGFVSVPLSIEDPIGCHETNVTGTLNVLVAARDHGVRRVIYASSSAVYGTDERIPKVEDSIGLPLSPYAASKAMNEVQAGLFTRVYGLETVGLRYFNVFGPRQNPTGGYAAVIPQWIATMLRGETCVIHGDGGITRDFCPVSDVVQANLLAATTPSPLACGRVFNIGLGVPTCLDELHTLLAARVHTLTGARPAPVTYGPPRPGDIRHSTADTYFATAQLEFRPETGLATGLHDAVAWYAQARSGQP